MAFKVYNEAGVNYNTSTVKYIGVPNTSSITSAGVGSSSYSNGVNAGRTLNDKIRMTPIWDRRKPKYIRTRR